MNTTQVMDWFRAAVRLRGDASHRSIAMVVIISASAYLCLFAGVLQRIGDEGTLVNGAARVAEGAVPYRDFADLANPLSFYWLGGWFAVFGTQLAVARVLLVLTGACTATLIFWLAARAYGTRTGLRAAILVTVLGIPFWPATNHHWDSNLFFLVVLCCLALWRSRLSDGFALLAGVAAAITAGFMINKGGLALVMALGIVWWSPAPRRLRAAIAVVIGFCGTVAAIGMVSLVQGAGSEALYINVVFPTTEYQNTGRVPYALYLPALAWSGPLSILIQIAPPIVAVLLANLLAVPWVLIAALPLCALTTVAVRRYAGCQRWGYEQRLLWIGGGALWLSEAHRWDLYHLMYGSVVMLAGVLGEVLAEGALRKERRQIVEMLMICVVALGTWRGAIGAVAQVRQETRRGVVRTYVQDDALQFLLDHTQPRDHVFVYPYYPMYYFLANLRNPTRYGILLYGYNTVEQFQEALADLDRAKPRYVLWDTVVDGDNWRKWYPAYARPAEHDLIIEPYLNLHYRTIATKSGFRILERMDGQSGVH